MLPSVQQGALPLHRLDSPGCESLLPCRKHWASKLRTVGAPQGPCMAASWSWKAGHAAADDGGAEELRGPGVCDSSTPWIESFSSIVVFLIPLTATISRHNDENREILFNHRVRISTGESSLDVFVIRPCLARDGERRGGTAMGGPLPLPQLLRSRRDSHGGRRW
jgi:hypothetical protein